MSNVAPAPVRNPADRGPATPATPARDGLDPRVARTTRALGQALIALVEERAFDGITVQDILDRAGVGRATFYAHYRNKHDVLYSSYEGLFAWLDPLVDRPSAYGPPGTRLFPVGEFVAHVGDAHGLLHALRRDGLLGDVWAMFVDYAARAIDGRLDRWAGASSFGSAVMPRALMARMLAGALVESVQWWQDHPSAATPAAMDAAFHDLARGVLRGPRP